MCQTDIQIIEDAEAVTGAANSHNSDRVEAAGPGAVGPAALGLRMIEEHAECEGKALT